jgi:hypothetical protein
LPEVPPVLELPEYEVPEPNGYEGLEEIVAAGRIEMTGPAFDILSELSKHPRALTDQEVAVFEQHLKRHSAELSRLEDALEMEWLYPHRATPATLFRAATDARGYAKLFLLQYHIALSQDDPEDALSSGLNAVRLGVKASRGGVLIHHLLGQSIDQMVLPRLTHLVAEGYLNRGQLLYLHKQLRSLQEQQMPLREALAREYHVQGPRALELTVDEFQELMGRDDTPRSLRGEDATEEEMKRYLLDVLPAFTENYAAVARLADQPLYKVIDQAKALEVPDELPTNSWMLQPIEAGILVTRAETSAVRQGTQIAIALELAKLGTGAYPESLDALSDLSEETLTDPFTGEPMNYEKWPVGYILYSVGRDMQDNSGNPGYGEGTDLAIYRWTGR